MDIVDFDFSPWLKRKQRLFGYITFLMIFVTVGAQDLMQDFIDGSMGINWSLAGLLALYAALFGLNYGKKYLQSLIEKRGSFEGQAALFGNVLDKKEQLLAKKGTGILLYNLTEDVYTMLPWYSLGRIQLGLEIFSLAVLAAYMLWMDVITGGIALALIGLSLLLAHKMSVLLSRRANESQKLQAELQQFLVETIKSAATIRQLRKEQFFGDQYTDYMDNKYKKSVHRVISSQAFYFAQLIFSQELIPVIVLFVGMLLSMLGLSTIGTAVIMMDLCVNISKSIQNIGELLPQKHTANEIFKRIRDIAKKESSGQNGRNIEDFCRFTIHINSYCPGQERRTVLKNIHWELPRGEIYILKGPSGSGKTTLLGLLAGFAALEGLDGEVLYNGIPVDAFSPGDYFGHVLYAQQNTVLVDGSLEENLLLGEAFPDDEISEVLHTCYLDQFVEERGKYFKIEEEGKNVSDGERQRIGLARFLLRRPQVLLLDEITSALDGPMREGIAKRLADYARKYGMTLIVVSHNDEFDPYGRRLSLADPRASFTGLPAEPCGPAGGGAVK